MFDWRSRVWSVFTFSVRYYYRNLNNMKSVALSQTNTLMPTVGLGTWQAPPAIIEGAVYNALELGYRHFDTAFNYNNEEAIGKAINKWVQDGKGSRNDLFITTKLPHVGNRAEDVEKFVKLQLERLQTSYVDLYLMHVPFGFCCNTKDFTPMVNEDGTYVLDMKTDHVATWKEIERIRSEGTIRNIGLSNFNQKQIENLIRNCTFKPQVLQVELHAYLQQVELRKFCAENDIVVTAYAPLGSPGAKDHFVKKYGYSTDVFPDLLGHPDVKDIANKYGRTPAQILLHFLVQQKVVVIPKSTNEIRMKENFAIYDFELTPSDMDQLKRLDKGEKGRIFDFLFWKGVENHPEYPFKYLNETITTV